MLILLFSLFTLFSTAQNNVTQNNDSESYLKVTCYKLQPKELNLEQDIDAKKVNLKIYYLKNSIIIADYQYFEPKNNEILFFYGINKETNKPEMSFKFHNNLKHIYKKKDFAQLIKIVEVLEYNVFPFPTDLFSSAKAYAALERI